MRDSIATGRIAACHDVSDGGLLVAVAEMALAAGIGAAIEVPDGVPPHAWLFGEDQGRYVVTTNDFESLLAAAANAGVPAYPIGRTGGAALKLSDGRTISLARLRAAHERWLPDFMAAP